MNNLQFLIYFILIKLINCENVAKAKITKLACKGDNLVCYMQENGTKLELVDRNILEFNKFYYFKYVIQFRLKPPNEFKNNKYGNPFPLIQTIIYFNEMEVERELFIKIKNVNKENSGIDERSSLLEGNYSDPYMILVGLMNFEQKNYHQKFIFYTDKFIYLEAKHLKYYKTKIEFPMNQGIDFFKNQFTFHIEKDTILDRIINLVPTIRVNKFKDNLKLIEKMCNEIRIEDEIKGSDFRDNEIRKLDEQQQEYHKSLSLIDWFRITDNIKKIHSICGEIDDNIKFNLNCTECESFFKLEKIDTSRFQFHFFIRKNISYLKSNIYAIKNINLRYEIICDRFNNVTDHYLQKANKQIKIDEKYLNKNQLNNSLIYSSNDFFYCGFYLPIKDLFKLDADTEFHFELNDKTQIELEFGIFSNDGKTRRRKWVRQFSLDFTTPNIGYSIMEYQYTLIGSLIGVIIVLFVCISCCIINKYKKLSRKLTQAGSRISNLNITSGLNSNISNLSDTSQLQSTNQPTNNQISDMISSLPTKISDHSSYIPYSRRSNTTSPSISSSNKSRRQSSRRGFSPSSFSSSVSELKTRIPRSSNYRSESPNR